MDQSQIERARDVVNSRWEQQPRVGIILGTGLTSFAKQIDVAVAIDYEQIPHFARSTALGHRGRLLCGFV